MDPHPPLSTKDEATKDSDQSPQQRYKDLISTLPLEATVPLAVRKYKGFWLPEYILPGMMAIHDRFVARPSDVLLVTLPKSGTTWLKALAFTTMHRHEYAFSDHPLLTTNPHDCLPFLELLFLGDPSLELDRSPTAPRLLATHMPLSLLPSSVTDSGCRIVYLCREPKDVLASQWHFLRAMRPGSVDVLTLSHVFELFCAGVAVVGPIWDHILEYWRESQRRPEKVLFLKYEDMIENIERSLRQLAEFMGYAFSEEEEKGGTVEEIIQLCSFDNLGGLDVNKSGRRKTLDGVHGVKPVTILNNWYFRKGKVGDWRNCLTLEMAHRLDEITEKKLHGSGLSFP